MISLLKSLRFKAAIIIFIFAMLPLNVALLVYSKNVESREVSALSANLTSQAQLIANHIVRGGYMLHNRNNLGTSLSSLKETYAGRLIVMDNNLKIHLDTYDVYENRTLIWENAIRSADGESLSSYDRANNLLVVTIPIGKTADIAGGDIQGVVMISRNTDYIANDVKFYKNLSLIIFAMTLMVALGGAYVFSKLLIRPVEELSTEINEVMNDNKDSLEKRGIRELDRLSDSVNAIAWKLSDVDTSMRDFASNVSHELKTPLTSMKIMADTLLATEDTPLEFYKEFMGDISSEIDRETNIINDLLSMTKTNVDTAKLEVEKINVNEFLEEILKILSPMAEKAKVELLIETFKPVIAEIDKVKMSQAMINLIENAIKYNVENGYVHVTVNADSNSCFIRIEDNGVGIPEDQIGFIFDRFYRVDKSHSKEIDGTGLGLPIVKNIISLHKGEIKVDSLEGKGSTFTVRIPLVYEL